MRRLLVAVAFFALLFSLSVQTEQDRAPLGIDEKLSEPGYLISVPAVIHPSLPRYLYRLYADDNGYPERIEVLDEQSKRVIQRMEWPNGHEGEPLDKNAPDVHFSDLDFDGYLDLMGVKFRAANIGFVIWMFDARKRQFVYSTELSDMWNLHADPDRKQLSTSSTGGLGLCSAQTLEWRGQSRLVVRTVDSERDDARGTIVKTVRERRGNRLVLVRREIHSLDVDDVTIELFDGERLQSTQHLRIDAAPQLGCQ